MAKDRNRRYASTTDLLLDLEAIARGDSPPQARKQIDSGLLTSLSEEAKNETYIEPPPPPPAGNLLVWVIVLGGALALSLIGNLLLALRH